MFSVCFSTDDTCLSSGGILTLNKTGLKQEGLNKWENTCRSMSSSTPTTNNTLVGKINLKWLWKTNKYFVHCKCRYILSSHQEKRKEKSPSNQNNYFSSMIFNYIAAIFCCYSLMGNHSPSLLRVSLFRHHLLASPNQPFLHFLCSSHEHNLDFYKTNKKRARERKWKGQDEEIEGVLKQNKSLPLRGK